MPIDLATLKEVGKDLGPVSRKGTGTGKGSSSGNKLPSATKCQAKGSSFCIKRCKGTERCPRNLNALREMAGYTLVQRYHGIAIERPNWVGKWKKL